MEQMKVGMYYNNRDVRVEEMPIPEVGDKDILIRVMASGICGTDLMEWYRTKKVRETGKGLIQGHEIAGEIVEVGKEVTKYKPGDRVFATHHVPCGRCYECGRGNGTLCTDFQKINNFVPGGFSEYVKITGKSVDTGIIKIPESMSYEEASFIEPLGTVFEAVDLSEDDTVLVLGSGVAGILNVKYARYFGKGKIVATDIRERRLKYAKQFGADCIINANAYSKDYLLDINEGRLADMVIVCAAAKSAAEQAIHSCGNGGTVIFFATPREGEEVGVDFFKLWRTGFTWKPTYGATPESCYRAFRHIGDAIKVDDMITHRFSLDDIAEGFRVASEGEGLKVIIEPHKND